MKILSHRGVWKERLDQNSLKSFATSQKQGFGTETDLRSYSGVLYLSHDPIQAPSTALKFENLISIWKETPKLPLFLNIKEDGLLDFLTPFRSVLEKLQVVFFDMSVPQLVQFSKVFPKSMLATRFSEYEPQPSAQELCSWLWVDSFHSDPSLEEIKPFMLEKKMSVAIVSPDLHGRDPKPAWRKLKTKPELSEGPLFLCTDLPNEAAKEEI